MNRVMAGYFDDAHRGLIRQQQQGSPNASSTGKLPPLNPNGAGGGGNGPPPGGDGGGSIWSKPLNGSKSWGSLEFSKEMAAIGVQKEEFQQALQNSSKLARKVRALQDQLSVASAKKEAFRAQAQRLEAEFRKGREQADVLQKELLEAKREAGQSSQEAAEAVAMMTEMRKSHIAEVKLLQRGLAARAGNDPSARNRVNEMADLIDKVGRAVVQRDEAVRDKTQMQAQLNKAMKDLHASSDEVTRLRKLTGKLSGSLKEAKRKGQYAPPRPMGDTADDSDQEFEYELTQFEKRFNILEEGPAGLDVLASNLSKDKQDLEKRCAGQAATIRSLHETIENWKALGAEKDQQISDLSSTVERTLRERALLEDQIAQKQREIAEQVEEERAAMQKRISELELECDSARAAADGMDKASNRLARELAKVSDERTGDAKLAGGEGECVATADAVQAKTGERLTMKVFKDGNNFKLHAKEPADAEPSRIHVSAALIKDLDEADPWTELFGRVGVDPGPPKKIVLSAKLGEKEVSLKPSGASVLLTAYRYSAKRYFVSGVDLGTQDVLSLAITEANLPLKLSQKLSQCNTEAETFEALAASLVVSGDGGSRALALAAA